MTETQRRSLLAGDVVLSRPRSRLKRPLGDASPPARPFENNCRQHGPPNVRSRTITRAGFRIEYHRIFKDSSCVMINRHGLFVLCAMLWFSNLFGQVGAPATTQPSANPIPTTDPHLFGTPPPNIIDPRITNLSTRARVAGDSRLIAGFSISGTTSRTVLVRAVGPTLRLFGLTGMLAAPRLRLHDSTGAVMLENAGWGGESGLVAATNLAGAFPLPADSADSAAVATLAPGAYTVDVSDDAGRGGVVLVEIYDVDGTTTGSRLVNVSTFNTVAAEGGEFISGFTVSGTKPAKFLMRGVGPGLTKFGVTGVLADPMLALFNSSGQQIAMNDDWNGPTKPEAGIYYIFATTAIASPVAGGGGVATAGVGTGLDPVTEADQATGAFALDSKSFDAAMVQTLPPGAYTVQLSANSLRVSTPIQPAIVPVAPGAAQPATVSGLPIQITLVPSSPGVALFEVYQVP